MVTICCWPHCEAAPSALVKLPLCDTHAVKAYRQVAQQVKEASATTRAALATATVVAPKHVSKRTPGEVYFLRLGDRVKIGFSANLARRLRDLPHEKLLAAVPGTMSTEKRLHARFQHLRVAGEWFRAEPELMDYIAGLGAAAK